MIQRLGPSFFTPHAGGATVGFTETWPGANHAALPGTWTVQGGAIEQDGSGHAKVTALTSSLAWATRNCNGADYTATMPVFVRDNDYPGLLLRTNAAGNDAIVVYFGPALHKLHYYEYLGGVVSNIVEGTTTWADSNTYTLQVILSGSSVIVKLGASTEITTTCQAGLISPTYIALFQAVSTNLSLFGQLTVA